MYKTGTLPLIHIPRALNSFLKAMNQKRSGLYYCYIVSEMLSNIIRPFGSIIIKSQGINLLLVDACMPGQAKESSEIFLWVMRFQCESWALGLSPRFPWVLHVWYPKQFRKKVMVYLMLFLMVFKWKSYPCWLMNAVLIPLSPPQPFLGNMQSLILNCSLIWIRPFHVVFKAILRSWGSSSKDWSVCLEWHSVPHSHHHAIEPWVPEYHPGDSDGAFDPWAQLIEYLFVTPRASEHCLKDPPKIRQKAV